MPGRTQYFGTLESSGFQKGGSPRGLMYAND